MNVADLKIAMGDGRGSGRPGEGVCVCVWGGGGGKGRSVISQLATLTAVGLLFEVEMQGIPYDQSRT